MDPILVVLVFSSLAAAASVVGVLPLAGRERMPVHWIGWANATAAGLMLGAAYALTETGFELRPLETAFGALLGIGYSAWTHQVSGTENLDLNPLGGGDSPYGYKILLVNCLHSASEGVAIGIAMAASLPFGIFMALAMAAHNVPEAAVLWAVLRTRGVRLGHGIGLALLTNSSQVLLALVTFGVVGAAPVLVPAVLGFSIGALVYLALVELLPESYREAGHTSIAIVTTTAVGIVVLLHGIFV